MHDSDISNLQQVALSRCHDLIAGNEEPLNRRILMLIIIVTCCAATVGCALLFIYCILERRKAVRTQNCKYVAQVSKPSMHSF